MIEARPTLPGSPLGPSDCSGCGGKKGAPIAGVFSICRSDLDAVSTSIILCEECGRDAANAIGYLCIRDGGWSKLEPRKKSKAKGGVDEI